MRPEDKIIDLVHTLTYKPGWRIEAWVQPSGGPWVQVSITCRSVDADDQTKVSMTAGNVTIPLHAAEHPEIVVDLIERRLHELERHEFKEFFRVGGVPVHAPHNPDGSFT